MKTYETIIVILVNLVAQMMVFATNLIISFSFYIIVLNKLGNETYGFVGLVNNFVSYISVIAVALNSLAGRFITLSSLGMMKKGRIFSSVFADTITNCSCSGCGGNIVCSD